MTFACLLGGLAAVLMPLVALGEEAVPTFGQLERRGAVIGDIQVDTQDIFDLDDPRENNVLYRAANRLHVTTKPWYIRRLLLFKSGDRVSRSIIEETRRVIRGSASVYDVSIRPIRYENGVVDILVRTRDTWTLQPSVKLSRAGGVTTGGFSIKEDNLAGTGTKVGVARSKDVDRTGTSLQFAHEHLFDGWTRIAAERSSFTDGSANALSVTRPFYSLDTPWAAGASASNFQRTDSIFRNGQQVGKFRHDNTAGEIFGGWSPGRVGQWTQRTSLGVSYSDDAYAVDPTLPPPTSIPADRTLAAPFVRHELIEDDFLEVQNRDQIRRPEYLAMGFHSLVQVGRSLAALGATDQPWLVSGSLSKGFRAFDDGQILTALSFSGQYGSQVGDVRSGGTSVRYFQPQRGSFTLYLAGSLDAVKPASSADELLLGGDNGLRGYPLRYQSGTRRAIFTAEERYYTDWFPFRLFRVGWAVYTDLGRAWGGESVNATPGWLADVGFGLRIANSRASFGNVAHIDLAFPLHRTDPNIKSYQLVVSAGRTF
jgi:outer membrane protein assembly factor BamA